MQNHSRLHRAIQLSIFVIPKLCLASMAGATECAPYSPGELPRERIAVFEASDEIPTVGGFDPFAPAAMVGNGVQEAMMEPLFLHNAETGAVEPWLAARYQMLDGGGRFEITLRRGVKWSDGYRFDADDVVFSIRRAMTYSRPAAPHVAEVGEAVSNVVKTGQYTVLVTLKSPDPRFLLRHFSGENRWSFPVVPEHLWSKSTSGKVPPPLGTGPYTWEATCEDRVIWKRNSDWWGVKAKFRPLPAPERLVWQQNHDEEERLRRAAAGEVDATAPVSGSAYDGLRRIAQHIVPWTPDGARGPAGPCASVLEINAGHPPFDNGAYRRAVQLAVNRERMSRTLTSGYDSPSRAYLREVGALSLMLGRLEKVGLLLPAAGNVEAARELLKSKEVGCIADAQGLLFCPYQVRAAPVQLQVAYNRDDAGGFRAARFVTTHLREFGFLSDEIPIAPADYPKLLELGAFQGVIGPFLCAGTADALDGLSFFEGDVRPGGPVQTWRDQDFIRFRAQMDHLRTLDPADAGTLDALSDAFSTLDATAPAAALLQEPLPIPYSDLYWTGWPIAGAGVGRDFRGQEAHRILHALRPSTDKAGG